jgi:outer membrane protein OmpA-like peptidoglycan-associated protein
MKRNLLAGILTALVVEMHMAPPAEACGVKLTIKSQTPRKAVARSSNPSDVLLLGEPPRRLERDLSAAGHRVEVAPSPAAAKRKSYAVVVTDSKQQEEARSSFSEAVILVRSGDTVADMRSVEKQVARKPVRADEGRTVVAARPTRQPIAAGPQPDPNRRVVAAKEPTEAPATTPTTPAPTPPTPTTPAERVTTTPARPPVEQRPVTPPAEPKPRPAAVAAGGPGEVFFAYNSFRLGSTAALDRTVRWLKDKSDVSIILEGHADPSGNSDDNMALAQRRAELVRDYLVSAGIDASRIEVVSFGDTRLKYGRNDGRNRRVAIVAK